MDSFLLSPPSMLIHVNLSVSEYHPVSKPGNKIHLINNPCYVLPRFLSGSLKSQSDLRVIVGPG
jgi:hypothetical protein